MYTEMLAKHCVSNMSEFQIYIVIWLNGCMKYEHLMPVL